MQFLLNSLYFNDVLLALASYFKVSRDPLCPSLRVTVQYYSNKQLSSFGISLTVLKVLEYLIISLTATVSTVSYGVQYLACT